MTKKIHKQILHITAFVGAITLAITLCLYSAFYGQAIDKESVIHIKKESTYSDLEAQIRPILRSALHRKAFTYYASRLNLEERFKGGRYLLHKEESVIRIVRKLALGEQTPVKLIIGEARTLPQLAGKLSKQLEADSATLLHTMYNKQIRKNLGYNKDSLIDRKSVV